LETARRRRADGQVAERTTGFNCVCFNEAAAERYIGPYARKGSRLVVSGHVENDTWTGKDGVVHYDLRLVVEAVRIKTRRDAAPPRIENPSPAANLGDEIPS
jgi:single-stranded DNA-binding protein